MNDDTKQALATKKETTDSLQIVGAQGAMKLTPDNMTQAMEIAKMMSVSGVAVPIGLRNNPGACLGVAMKAWNWGMEPYSVAAKVYVVKNKHGSETLAYEGQLVHAVVNTRAPLSQRLRTTYSGQGEAMICIVTGFIKGEEEPFIYETPPMANIPVKNSPLWKSDAKQQLGYFAVRAWARRHVPEVIMGVYTPEEIDETVQHRGPDNAKDVTPRPEAGDYDDVEEVEPEEGDIELFSQFGEVIGTYTEAAYADAIMEEANRLQAIHIDKVTFATFMDNNYPVISKLPKDIHASIRADLTGMYKAMEDSAPAEEPAVAEPQAPEGEPAPVEEPEPEPEPETEFIHWQTTSGKWKFRNLKEVKGYLITELGNNPLTVDDLQMILSANDEVLARYADTKLGQDVAEIRKMIEDQIHAISTQEVQKENLPFDS